MLYLTRPGTPHDYGPKRGGDWRIRWSHFHPRPHWLQWLDWPEVVPGLMMLQVNDAANWSQIIGALETAARQVAGPPPRSIHFAMNTLEQMLLWCDAVNPRSQRMRFDPRVADAMEYICRRLGEKIILADVARAVHLSPSRLAHLFREQVGLTPGQFLEQQRMDRARQLLQLTPLPVSAVADQLGFDSPFYFTRRFTRLTGRSPRQYRQETSGEAATSAGGTA
jgi:AraC family transcriptional regulator of arabinose operon